jgi:hypothetical protein
VLGTLVGECEQSSVKRERQFEMVSSGELTDACRADATHNARHSAAHTFLNDTP